MVAICSNVSVAAPDPPASSGTRDDCGERLAVMRLARLAVAADAARGVVVARPRTEDKSSSERCVRRGNPRKTRSDAAIYSEYICM
jgi:hypothetical protein